ncbi:MAG TPA: hypothetical protein VGM37_08535 [Armatimonadota bacterium]
MNTLLRSTMVISAALLGAFAPARAQFRSVPPPVIGVSRVSRVPGWAVGAFRSRDRDGGRTIELTISRNGDAVTRISDRRGKDDVTNGSFRDGQLRSGGRRYDLERTGRGFRTVEVGNRRNTTEYVRTGEADADVPDWAVGTFEGRNRAENWRIRLEISASGRSVTYVYDQDNHESSHTEGTFRDGKLTTGRHTFRVERTRAGIDTIGSDGDRTSYRRVR